MPKAAPSPVRVVTFGQGSAPAADVTLDLRRHFRTPGRRGVRALLAATVRTVQAYDADPAAPGLVVAVGAGRRSAAADALARRLRRRGHVVTVEHR